MKKLIISIAAVVLSAAMLSAQTLAEATETFNSGAEVVNTDKAAALDYFQKALTMATALGDEGVEIVSQCKNLIPNLHYSMVNDLIKASDFDGAIAKLNETIAAAKEFEAADVVAKAEKLVPQVLLQKGNALLTAKNYEGAVAAYKEITDADPTNGMAALRLGMAYSQLNKADEAIAALKAAAANGQEANANKQLGTVLLKEASNVLKEKDYEKAMELALQSAEYAPSANAYKIAGTAATSLTKKAEAVEYLSKYLELSPTAADAAQIKTAIEALKK